MKLKTLDDLYLDQIQDLHSAEKQLIKALPHLVKAATHPDLAACFTAHLAETQEHLIRLDRILSSLGEGPGRKVCQAMSGLVEECDEMIGVSADHQVRDAGLICAAQKAEHYEIATYGCLRTYATLLGKADHAHMLELTLAEEKHADVALTALAMKVINPAAMTEEAPAQKLNPAVTVTTQTEKSQPAKALAAAKR